MRGLLTKDFALFFQRKKTFIFLAVWAGVMCFVMHDGSFMVGWMTIINAFFAVSSLTYDEFDNCYPFLMSLPVNGRIYALEKYAFGFIAGFGAWIFSVAIYLIYSVVAGVLGDFGTELIQVSVMIPVFMLLIDISLPLNLKFGTEKGRAVILILWGVAFLGVFVADKVFDVTISADMITSAGPGALVLAFFGICVVLTVISIMLSIRIMNKKEY